MTIKEKLSVGPHALRKTSSASTNLRIEFNWINLYNYDLGPIEYPLHLGIIGPDRRIMGFDESTESIHGNYSDTTIYRYYDGPGGAADYYAGQSIYIDSNAQMGDYYLYAFADTNAIVDSYWGPCYADVYESDTLTTTIVFDFGGATYVDSTRYNVVMESFLIVLPCVAGGAPYFVLDGPSDMQHGQTLGFDVSILDTCGNTVDNPPESYFKFELAGDTSTGMLLDPITLRTGTVLDSVSSTFVLFEAWGKDPDMSTELSLTVSADNGSISPASTTFFVEPSGVRVIAGKPTYGDTTVLSYGDTTLLTMQVRDPGGAWVNNPADWWPTYQIVQGDTFGFMYNTDSTREGARIAGFPVVIFSANSETAPDSTEVLIQLMSRPPGGPIGAAVSPGPGKKVTQGRKTKTSGLTVSSISPRQGIRSPSTDGAMHYGLARLLLKKNHLKLKIVEHNPHEIWPYLPPQTNGYSRGADQPGYDPKRGFEISVRDTNGQPMENEAVKITRKFVPMSGGHQHNDPEMPDNLQGMFWGQGRSGFSLALTTNAKGIALVDSFVASQNSGSYIVTAFDVADTTVKDTVQLSVKVPDLIDFSSAPGPNPWQLTGARAEHPSNHWCRPIMQQNLGCSLSAFYVWASSKNGRGSPTLHINDMSLLQGGVFDIDGHWDSSKKHSFHRVGLSVDIDNTGLQTQALDKNKNPVFDKNGDPVYVLTPRGIRLKKIIADNGGEKYPEGPIHFGFGGN